jgi:hypothetical protein
MTTINLLLGVILVFLLTTTQAQEDLSRDQRLNLFQLISNSKETESDIISLAPT